MSRFFSLLTCLSAALLFLANAPARASELAVHICVDARGHVTYQDMPCTDDQRTHVVRTYRSQAIDPALAARTRAIEQEMDRRNQDRRNRGGAVRAIREGKPAKSGADPCKVAKARRKAMLDRAGVKRGYELLGEIDREVWALCKGL